MVFGRGGDLRSCRDYRVVLRRRVLECLDRRRYRERPRSPSRRRYWHPRLLSGYGRSRGWLRTARNPGRTASVVVPPRRRLRGTRRRWRLLRRLRRGGRSSSRGGQASSRTLGSRSALAARRRRLSSRPLLGRRTSLRRAATHGRGGSTRLRCRLGLRTHRRRRHRLGRRELRARRLSGRGGRRGLRARRLSSRGGRRGLRARRLSGRGGRRCLLYGWSGRVVLNPVGLLPKPQSGEERLLGLWRRWRIPYGYRARSFRAGGRRAGSRWTARSRRTRLGRGDLGARLTGRFLRRVVLCGRCRQGRRLR